MEDIVIQLVVFAIVTFAFYPLLNRTIKLAFAVYDNRDNLTPKYFWKTILAVSIVIIISFILIYGIVMFLFGIYKSSQR